VCGAGSTFVYGIWESTFEPLQTWKSTVHGAGGIPRTFDFRKAWFASGTERSADVRTIAAEGVAPRRAREWVTPGRIQIEDCNGRDLFQIHFLKADV
jgi:hypothetical protein